MERLPHLRPDARREIHEHLLGVFVEVRERVLALELESDELEQALHAFERYYLGRVQHLHALLDALRAEVMEAWVRRVAVEDAERAAAYAEVLEEARARARESAEAIPEDPPERFERLPADAEVTRHYHRIARKVHPDLADCEEQARLRHSYMAELNAAYKAADMERMQAVEDAWESTAVDVEEDLDGAIGRLRRQVTRARRRIEELQARLRTLREGDVHALMQRVQDGEARGHDVLADIVTDLERQIEEARLDLAQQREEAAR